MYFAQNDILFDNACVRACARANDCAIIARLCLCVSVRWARACLLRCKIVFFYNGDAVRAREPYR